MHSYLQPLAELFKEHANPDIARGAKSYMRNQFDFFGCTMPLRRQLTRAYFKHALPDYKDLGLIVKQLWDLPEREFQYTAIELVAACKKIWKEPVIELIQYLITHKSWWDTVDFIASELSGPYFTHFPAQIIPVTAQWNNAENIWLQRSSLLFQKSYRKETDTALLSRYILHLANSKEFFVRKAIGWALREYSKTNPGWVIQFVHEHELSALSKREAMKRIG